MSGLSSKGRKESPTSRSPGRLAIALRKRRSPIRHQGQMKSEVTAISMRMERPPILAGYMKHVNMERRNFRMLRCAMAGVEAVAADTRHVFPRHTHDQFGI